MNVRPTEPGQPQKPGPGRLRESPAGSPARPVEKAPLPPEAPARDRVELSEAARELQAQLGLDKIPVAELPPQRLREILDRLKQGYYDRPEVRDELLQRLAGDLGIELTES
jgi:hypothetical protein